MPSTPHVPSTVIRIEAPSKPLSSADRQLVREPREPRQLDQHRERDRPHREAERRCASANLRRHVELADEAARPATAVCAERDRRCSGRCRRAGSRCRRAAAPAVEQLGAGGAMEQRARDRTRRARSGSSHSVVAAARRSTSSIMNVDQRRVGREQLPASCMSSPRLDSPDRPGRPHRRARPRRLASVRSSLRRDNTAVVSARRGHFTVTPVPDVG